MIEPYPADIWPVNDANELLRQRVHPRDWRNPPPDKRYNLVVVGGGTAGLVSAMAAAGLGAKVALVERRWLGGDCLNVGCVPSKCLIRSARAAADARDAGAFGVRVGAPVEVDFAAVMARMYRLRTGISEHDSVQRLTAAGVDVFLGDAAFTGVDSLEVGGETVRFSKAVIATGSRPLLPPIAGLQHASYLTNETIFSLTELPRHLLVIGGGPIGVEMGQAFRRFGSEVTIISRTPHLLPHDDEEAVAIVQNSLESEGVRILHNAEAIRVEGSDGITRVDVQRDTGIEGLAGDVVLVSAGRVPNVEALQLDAAGVAFTQSGVVVDERFRTTNRRIYAAGDCCMHYKFTHAADAAARAVVQNALFWGRKKQSALAIPWCTYTDPEVAHVGLTERDGGDKGVPLDTVRISFADVDRAVVDGEEEGLLKVHLRAGTDTIVGATLVARHAGEMLGELVLAMQHGIGLSQLANVIHPYPTQAEAIRKAADAYNRKRLTPRVKSFLERVFVWRR